MFSQKSTTNRRGVVFGLAVLFGISLGATPALSSDRHQHESFDHKEVLTASAHNSHGSVVHQHVASQQITEERHDGKLFQVARCLVKVKPEQVWQILADYDNAQYVFPCLKKCRLVKDNGSTKIVEHQLKPTGFPGTFKYTIAIKEVPHKSQYWHRVSGDFQELDGFWKLDPVDGGAATLVTYGSHVSGGLFLPSGLIKRQFRIDMPLVLAALRSSAETTRHIAVTKVEHNH